MSRNFVPFWTWNKRKSPMTMTPKRVASGKAPFSQRVLKSLSGVPLYRKWEKHVKNLKHEQQSRMAYAEKFGRLP